jgi:arylformamidase
MKIYDVSLSLHNGMQSFPGDPPPDIKRILMRPIDAANVSLICMGTHTGTHVDPPFHFIEEGYTVDRIPLDHLYGPAEVLDLTHVKDAVTGDDLKGARSDILLLKTKNSRLWDYGEFRKDFVYLDESAAKWVVEKHVKTLGIDYLSIGSFKAGEEVHRILLGGGVTVIEGLDLREISAGLYTLACLPLKIKDGDGAPARAFLIKE